MQSLFRKAGRLLVRVIALVVPPCLAIGLCAAIVMDTLKGDRGTRAQDAKRLEIADAQARLERLSVERGTLEHRVNSLRGATLDLDLLDERARKLLNQFGRDELVIPYEPGQRLQ